jgi:hypothetical protein
MGAESKQSCPADATSQIPSHLGHLVLTEGP